MLFRDNIINIIQFNVEIGGTEHSCVFPHLNHPPVNLVTCLFLSIYFSPKLIYLSENIEP